MYSFIDITPSYLVATAKGLVAATKLYLLSLFLLL